MLRGIKTLAVRMRQHCHNAHAISGFLERHPRVEQVLYPGLPRHPGHTIAARQMRDFGGMISFLADSEEEAAALVASTKIFKLAESLGGVESLIELPARMTHASTAKGPFAAFMIPFYDMNGMARSPTAMQKWGTEYGLHPVGTGPFKFVEYQKDSQTVLEKNPDYWDKGKPAVDRLIFRPNRAESGPDVDEFRDRNRHRSIGITLKQSFGGSSGTGVAKAD